MSRSLRAGLIALLTGSSVVLSALVPSAAFADEITPSPIPIIEPTAEPTAEPTLEPTPDPIVEPSAAPVDDPPPLPAPIAASYSVAGTFTRLSGEDRILGSGAGAETDGDGTAVLTVPGSGFLLVDATKLGGDLPSGAVAVSLAVPAGLQLAGGAGAAFQQLALYSASTEPLVVQSISAGRTSARATPYVNQTPNTAAVHEIYAVLVAPNAGGKGADQTAAKVAATVAGANDYWSEQSSGSVQFHLAGTTTWYSSQYDCRTDGGSTALWNQAASVAASQLGYVAGRNVHLVLFFPGNLLISNGCGGAAGLGSIGSSANSGGVAWVLGTEGPTAQSILSHELGHNLSLGHANLALCSGTEPAFSGASFRGFYCSIPAYGDLTDVMGYSQPGRSGGALSSAQAIRASLWPTSAYDEVLVGTTDFTLNAVSANTGLRSVVINDPYSGDRYFVEYRNLTGEDAQYAAAGCNSTACAASTPGIRVLRFDDELDCNYLCGIDAISYPGDNSYLLGRTTTGASVRVNYVVGETFRAQGSSQSPGYPQVKVEVLSIDGDTATIRVTRPPLQVPQVVRVGAVTIVPALSYDGSPRVGDTWTTVLDNWWSAENYTFQWYRNDVAISGATDGSYTLAPDDLGAHIKVSVTGTSVGAYWPETRTDPRTGSGYGPILKGVYDAVQPGGVAIDNTSSLLQASPTSWPSGTTFAYQWFRGATSTTATTAVSGAVSSTYSLSGADGGQFIRLRVTATPPGYNAAPARYSAATNFSLRVLSGAISVSGTPAIGLPLTPTSTAVYGSSASSVTPTALTYQWLRNGAAIAGATGSVYTPVPTDFGTKISVRVVASAPGYLPVSTLSSQSPAIAKGTLTGSFAIPEVAQLGMTLTADLPAGSIDSPEITKTYQWFRGAVAITGATKITYPIVAADYGQLISVKVTSSKLNYNSLVLQSAPISYSLVPSAVSPVITGEIRVGATLAVVEREYTARGTPVGAAESLQWFRNGVAIPAPLGTGDTYVVAVADLGKTLTVRVTASVSTYLPAIATSAPTQTVGSNTLDGWNDQESVSVTATSATVLTASGTGITGPLPVTAAYQWYRGSLAVAGATKPTYSLTAADYGKPIWVRVVTSKATYTTIVKTSLPLDYSVVTLDTLSVVNDTSAVWRVGERFSTSTPSFTTKDGAITPTLTYQWLRNGVAIAGATSPTYIAQAADLKTKITARMTATAPGYVSRVLTSGATPTLGLGVILGTLGQPEVARSSAALLAATVPGGVVTTPTTVLGYQWYRNAVAVAGATKSTYQLTSADNPFAISVRVTVTKVGFAAAVLPQSAAISYAVTPNSPLPPIVTTAAVKVGDTLTAPTLTFTALGDPVVGPLTYQWYRNGLAIAGATSPTYLVQSADYTGKLSVTVRIAPTGFASNAWTSTATTPVVKGVWPTYFSVPSVTGNAAGLLTVAAPTEAAVVPGVVFTYQWFRNAGTAIVGAIKPHYQLTAADGNATVWVKVTAVKANMTTANPVLASTPTPYSVLPDAAVVVTGSAVVGETLTLSSVDYNGGTIGPGLSYQWLRNGISITGATASSYVVASTDFATKITARVTAASPGLVSSVVTTAAPSAVVAKGELRYDPDAQSQVTASLAGVLTASLPVGAVTSPGITLTYQWTRNNVPILGATKATYTLTGADGGGALIRVRISVSKVNVVPTTWTFFPSDGVNYTLDALGPATIDDLTSATTVIAVADQLSAVAPEYAHTGDPVVPTFTYQWLRNGVVIAGATASSYSVRSADYATKLSVRVTANAPGLLPLVLATPVSSAVVKGDKVVGDSTLAAAVTVSPARVLSATIPSGAVNTVGAVIAYQWYRTPVGGSRAAIAGATKSTYALVAADYNTLVSVIVTATMANMLHPSLALAESTPTDYSLRNGDAIGIDGDVKTDSVLTAVLPSYAGGGDPVVPTFTFQWLRNGIAITGAASSTYLVQAADFNTKLSVRVVAAAPSWIANVTSSAPTAPVIKGDILVTGVPVVTSTAARVLTATLPVGTFSTPGVGLTYQWFRNTNTVIGGATKQTYALTAADGANATVWVRVTATKANLTSAVIISAPVNYTATFTRPTLSSTDAAIGTPLAALLLDGANAAGDPVTPVAAYQWLRAGVAIAGATAATYTPVVADLGKPLSVRATVTAPGYLTNALAVSEPTTSVVLGSFTGSLGAPVVTGSSPSVLTARLAAGTIDQSGVTLAYQWYRAGAKIVGATAAVYTLAPSLDYNIAVQVKISITKAGYNQLLVESSPSNYSILATGDVTLDDSVTAIGTGIVSVSVPTYALGADTWSPPPAAYSYQWYVNGVAVVGAAGTSSSYTVVASNVGKQLTLRLTVREPGYLPVSTVSDPITVDGT